MINNYLTSKLLILFLGFILIAAVSSSFTAIAVENYQATTTNDDQVPMNELELSLMPLFKNEVKVELDAWLILLKQQANILSEAEILVSRKRSGVKVAREIATLSAKTAKDTQKLHESKDIEPSSIEGEQEKLEKDVLALKNIAKNLENPKAREVVNSLSNNSDELNLLSEKAVSYSNLLDEKRNVLIGNITTIREKKNSILERFYLVLYYWELKGGDGEEFRLYANSMSITKIDLTDSSAAWLTIAGWLRSKDGGLLWLGNIVKFFVAILTIFLISFFAGKAVDKVLARNKNLSKLLKEFLQTSVRRIILGVGFLVSLTFLQVNVGPVLALIGAAGLVIGLALQSTLSNFASGMLILIYRPFDIGDVIKIDNASGFVHSMNLLSTSIKTFDNQHLIIPNNTVWGSTINNVTGSKTRRVDLIFGIGYGDDMDKAQAIIERIVNDNSMVLPMPEPRIKLHELAESSVNFICRPWVKTENYWDVYWDITRQVKEQFDLEGVSIPFPQRDIHVHQVANKQTG